MELHSTPIQLGTAQLKADGNFDLDVTIPTSVSAGFHTLHIFGYDIAGDAIDMHKTVYIAASEEDYDGDGIDNEDSPCVFVVGSGIDVDEDGIDDACDPYIGELPPEEEPEDPEDSGDPEQQAYAKNNVIMANIRKKDILTYKREESTV